MIGKQEEFDDVLLFYKDLIEAIPLRYGDQRETIESETLSLLDIETKYINEVTITSISRFKGLESDIVVLVVPNLDELEAPYVSNPKTLLYVGLSRAKVNLFFLCGTEVSNFSNWKL